MGTILIARQFSQTFDCWWQRQRASRLTPHASRLILSAIHDETALSDIFGKETSSTRDRCFQTAAVTAISRPCWYPRFFNQKRSIWLVRPAQDMLGQTKGTFKAQGESAGEKEQDTPIPHVRPCLDCLVFCSLSAWCVTPWASLTCTLIGSPCRWTGASTGHRRTRRATPYFDVWQRIVNKLWYLFPKE